MSSSTSLRLAVSLSAACALMAIGPLSATFAAESAGEPDAPSEVVIVDPDEIGDPGPDSERPTGDEDAEPTPPGADGADRRADANPVEAREEPQPTDGGTAVDTSRGSDAEAGQRTGGAVARVDKVPLARTGFPALVLATLGGASLLTGLCLLGRLRRPCGD